MKRVFLHCFVIFFVVIAGVNSTVMASVSDFSVGLRTGYYALPNWSKTYDAIYGNGGEFTLGVEVTYGITKKIEFGLSIEMLSGDGQRVWPGENGGWVETGDSISFSILPVTLFSRYYLTNNVTFSPFVGLGVGFVSFKETDEEKESGFGIQVSGGVKWVLGYNLSLLVEGDYSTYPNVIGSGDMSAYYNEDDIGGMSLIVAVRYSI